MQRILSVLAAGLLMSAVGLAQAKPAGSGVAVIDFNKAVTGTKAGTKAEAEMSTWGTKKKAELDGQQKQIDDLKGKMASSSPTVQRDLEAQIQRLTRELNYKVEDARTEQGEKQEKLFANIVEAVRKAVAAVAERNGLEAVMDISGDGNSGVVYFPEGANITAEVIREADAIAAKAAPAAAAPAAGAPAASTGR